jgi:quercetin dioxygenase-like cupin family protein
MRRTATRLVIGLFLLAASFTFAQTGARQIVRLTPEQVKWVDEPDGLGFKTAVIDGDPAKPGLYVIWVKFPPGVMSKPHYHGEDRHALVIKGTWWTGTGDDFTPDKTVSLKPGNYMKHPSGVRHYDGAKDEEVILQLIGIGPSSTTRVRPQEGLFAPSVKK